MSLAASIRPSDDLAIKWMKLQRMVREAVDGFGISYSLGGYLTDIRPGDTEGLKWAKLGAWVELLAGGGGSGPGGTGDVTGPASATDGRPALFDGATGKLLKEASAALGTLAFQNGTFSGASSGTNTGDQTSVSGNAGTATALATSRNIDGVAFNGTANITVIAPATNAATTKATPADADELPIVDSAASNVLKKLTWANLKATAKAYFDTLYQAALSFTGTGATVRETSPTIVTPTVTTSLTGTGALTITSGGSNGLTLLAPVNQNITLSVSGSGFLSTNAEIRTSTHIKLGGNIEKSGSGILDITNQTGGMTRMYGAGIELRLASGNVEINSGVTGTYRDLTLRNLTPTGGNGLAVFTVATLPATAATGLFTGSRVYVTDSNAASYTAGIGAVVAAGGSTIVPVFYNGTNWLVG